MSRRRDIVGYALTWSDRAIIDGWQRERFLPGAFGDTIRRAREGRHEIQLRLDHDPLDVLATTKDGTLVLMENDIGLGYAASVDASDWRYVRALGYRAASVKFVALDDRTVRNTRGVYFASLMEISITDDPAYKSSSVILL